MRFISLMSGGIDSPVATHMVLEKGHEVIILNMDSRPLGSDEETIKVLTLASILYRLHPGRVRLFRAPHGRSLCAFKELSEKRYTCLLCKRAMLLSADQLCDRTGSDGIVMGDSMGQVASQTLDNMAAVSRGITHPIIRPLIGYDKVEIEEIARRIGTFEVSSRTVQGCTAPPSHPVLKAPPWRLEEESKKAGMDGLVASVLDDITEIALQE